MGFFNRFLLFLYALLVALASLGAIALCLNVLPVPMIQNELKFLLSRWETIAAAAFLFLWSVHMMGASFSRSGESKPKKKDEPEAVLVKTANGEVRVLTGAVCALIEKCAMGVFGVREARAKVHSTAEGEGSLVEAALDVAVDDDQNVGTVSDYIRGEVDRNMKQVLGLETYKLAISVTEIARPETAARRVR
ncbi:MAG: alkaline shock response membrane anchor protein AmaP [Schwartzia sp.]|nr:alkaline shock response membrane anchor protein AmaP [Schwartzia sp. (in: firmicutes)]